MAAPRFVRFFRHINLTTLRQVIRGVMAQRLPSLSAEMAYNALLALFPAVLAVLTAVSLFQPLTNSFERLMGRLSDVAPVDALNLIENFAQDITTGGSGGLFSVSFLIALWVSSSALSAAMRALDQIHQIPPKLMRPFWKAKLISLGLTVGTIVLLLLASGLVFLSDLAVRNLASQSTTLAPWLIRGWRWLTWPFALGIMSLAFAFVYRFGPSRWSPNKPLFPGAVLAAISWALISNGFRLYVLHFGNYNKVYGTVGAVIVLQLWLYMSALVMLIGDQVNVTVGEAMQERDRQRLAAPPGPSRRPSKSSPARSDRRSYRS
jgi:membrane protein